VSDEAATLPRVMGIVNVTPDSFSDGGRYLDPERAVAHGLELLADGASVLDVGGESTRPGATTVGVDEELRRVLPVVEALSAHARVSIDTRKAEVARAAVAAGATLVNDVSAELWPVAAELGVGWVAMHMRGEPGTMQDAPAYGDVVAEVCAFLEERATLADKAGVPEIWVDPGFGFGKSAEHNLTLLAHLDRVVDLGWPVLVGTSRKATLGRILADSDGSVDPVPPDDRLAGSIATEVWAMQHGAAMVRAHDVRAAVQASKVVAA
jgi:dihydropteroate synthase